MVFQTGQLHWGCRTETDEVGLLRLADMLDFMDDPLRFRSRFS